MSAKLMERPTMPVNTTWDAIRVRQHGRVGIIELYRPEALNAISPAMIVEILAVLTAWERDTGIGAVLIHGSERAFAAGADIKAMDTASMVDMQQRDILAPWDRVAAFKKPLIAAVSGFALGGGCELAMLCDIIVASTTATFGQPEIKLGVMPGAGGTQRLTQALGKSRAMQLILTGDTFTAQQAYDWGLASQLSQPELLLDDALALATRIAEGPAVALATAKHAVLKAINGTLADGLDAERQLFYSLFATADQKEGMAAFVEKRAPVFRGE